MNILLQQLVHATSADEHASLHLARARRARDPGVARAPRGRPRLDHSADDSRALLRGCAHDDVRAGRRDRQGGVFVSVGAEAALSMDEFAEHYLTEFGEALAGGDWLSMEKARRITGLDSFSALELCEIFQDAAEHDGRAGDVQFHGGSR